MTKAEIEQLAVEVVQKFLAEWQDTTEVQVVEQNGEPFLIVQPSDLAGMRDKEVTLHINLRKFH